MDYITGEENNFIKMYNNRNIMDDRYVEKVKDTYTVSDLSTNQCPMKRFHWGRGSPIYLGHMVTIFGIL